MHARNLMATPHTIPTGYIGHQKLNNETTNAKQSSTYKLKPTYKD